MARTATQIHDVTRAGVALNSPFADAANGNYLDTPERCVLVLYNYTGAPIVVTLQYNGTFDGLSVAGRTVTVPATTTLAVGNLNPSAHFQDSDSGRLYYDSASASLTVYAVRFPLGLR